MAFPDVATVVQRRPKMVIIAITVSVLVAVAGLHLAESWANRRQILRGAERRAQNTASVLAEYVHGAFAVVDASLRQLTVHAREVGGPGAPAEDWIPLLESARVAMGGTSSISVADTEGIIRHSTNPALVGQPRRDQFLYRYFSTTRSDDFVVDTPLLTPAGSYVIPIGRRLSKPDGRFDGVVATSVSPEMYREFIRTFDVGSQGTIAVFHPDGVVVFREPSPSTNPIGQSAKASELFQAAMRERGSGLLTGAMQPDGPIYVSAYHTIATPPLIVTVSLHRDEVLAHWWRQRRTEGLAFAALTLTLAGILGILVRQIDARGRIERELGEMQRLEASRLRTANERLAEALAREQQARRETETASYLKDEFLMTVSHELRTPLTAIFGWVRMLASGTIPPDEQARALAAVERNARAQTRLIDDLLDVSRAISGKLRIDARPIRLNDVILEALETVRPALRAKNIRLESSMDDHIQIVADPDRVQQIVWNLLSNAIKFTPEGGSVRLRAVRHDTDVAIEVSDTGAGIAPDFLPHVFERFRQAEAGSRRRYGGLGLGLAIVRHLTELHGGRVRADSPGEGQGSTFTVHLPIRAAASLSTSGSAPDTTPDTAPVASRLAGVRILVVDDEADARDLFASMLSAAGAAVVTASSAHEAVEVLRRKGDLVLLSDIEMPVEDGYELLRRARALPGADRRQLLAIAVTAYARPIDRQRALDAGFDAHLAKPVDPDDLVTTIASLLGEPASPLEA